MSKFTFTVGRGKREKTFLMLKPAVRYAEKLASETQKKVKVKIARRLA